MFLDDEVLEDEPEEPSLAVQTRVQSQYTADRDTQTQARMEDFEVQAMASRYKMRALRDKEDDTRRRRKDSMVLTLWSVRCIVRPQHAMCMYSNKLIITQPGKEKDSARRLSARFPSHSLAMSFSIPSLPGRFYVKAESEAWIHKRRLGLAGIEHASMKYVPSMEQIDIYRMYDASLVADPVATPTEGDWVYFGKGRYKGDLARVRVVHSDGTYTVALVPRIAPSKVGRRSKPHLFTEENVEAWFPGEKVSKEGDCY